ncbi:hypothetical protein [Aquimarina brevivitae]|uniref:Uncharacterized protein n=1 Tax=Aquimarina brevivitae TaxID=323412 RepID=A0A4Q7P1Y7_9FLAO|nr:hypothetical protein [Aquimarina brevivitae]RZS93348.1 hypothetical protein EV197_1926 [Aquimarina brevivitae]
MLKSILKLNGVKQLQRNQQKQIKAGGAQNPPAPCSGLNPCARGLACCGGVCIDLTVALDHPHCFQLDF